MRILGFNRKWPKLKRPTFIAFRFTRRDKRDWEIGEVVQVVYKPLSKEREILGLAEITNKEPRNMVKILADERTVPTVSLHEAHLDGFRSYWQMWEWLFNTYGGQRLIDEPMNKLTLSYISFQNKDMAQKLASRQIPACQSLRPAPYSH